MTEAILPAVGIHYEVPTEQYNKWPAIRWSTLKLMRSTASKCKYAIDNPKEPTPAMKMGTALHTAVLEPAEFDKLFYIYPKCDRRTKEGKQEYFNHESAAAGKLMIAEGSEDHDEMNRLKGMAASIRSLKSASVFLDCPGRNEVSLLWKDVELGIMCKARLDRWCPDVAALKGRDVIVEIKTTQDASEWSFGKDLHSMGYAGQCASYKLGIKTITGKVPIHVFIVVESSPPFDARVLILDDAGIQSGESLYRALLERYDQCQKSGVWPGYEDKIKEISLPGYAQ